MTFVDEASAKSFLLIHNYYSAVNGYKDMFLDKDKTNQDVEFYRSGTDFLYLQALYLFDRALRRQTLSELLDIEESMRTAVIYAFSEKHRGGYDYLDPSCYCSSNDYRSKRDYAKNLIKLLSTLQAVSENRQHKKPIAHYLREYGYVPLWVMSKCLTFGVMSNFFELQQPDVKQKASDYLSQTIGHLVKPKQFRRAYKVLSSYRNICAHEERLYCARTGRNEENAFKEMMLCIKEVSSDREVHEYARRIWQVFKLLSSPVLPSYILDEVMSSMRVSKELLASM